MRTGRSYPRQARRLNKSILQTLEPRQLLAFTVGSTETDVFWDWSDAGYWVTSPITITGAPAGAIATSIGIGWNIDANDLTMLDYRLTGPGGYTSPTSSNLPYSGSDPFSGFAETSVGSQNLTLPANIPVNGTWSFNIMEWDDWMGMGRIDSWSIIISYTSSAPEIRVTGNSLFINDGDTTPSTIDNTDFGRATLGGTGISKSFLVENIGTGPLSLGTVNVPAGYTITQNLPASIPAGGSANLIVTLNTATAGTFSGDISFTTNDADENPFNFRITGVVQPNQAPTDISLSTSTIAENQPSGTIIGTFTTTDPDLGDTFSYALVSGAGDQDNTLFQIVNNELRSAASLDFEDRSFHYIRVRSTDQVGHSYEREFVITATNVNEAPADILLSSTAVPENQPIGTIVATLAAADEDDGGAGTFSYALVSGAGDQDNGSFNVIGTFLVTAAVFDYELSNIYSIRLRVTDQSGLSFERAVNISVTNVRDTTIAGRKLFYNNSAFDGNNPAATTQDDAAIATDKIALRPGQTATFTNYSSYSRGINGIMVDLQNFPGTLSAADFALKVGNDSTPSAWATAPAPTSVTQRTLPNGDTRVTLIWPDNAIQKQWLQVTVLANATTDLPADYVFYFGNAIGECSLNPTNAQVTTADEALTRNNQSGLSTVAITNWYDFNRDGRVNSQDIALTRNNRSGLTPLQLITAPASLAAMQPAKPTTLLSPTAAAPKPVSVWSQSLLHPEGDSLAVVP